MEKGKKKSYRRKANKSNRVVAQFYMETLDSISSSEFGYLPNLQAVLSRSSNDISDRTHRYFVEILKNRRRERIEWKRYRDEEDDEACIHLLKRFAKRRRKEHEVDCHGEIITCSIGKISLTSEVHLYEAIV